MANKKTQFRETFEEMLENGKDIFLVDEKCEQDALDWWFDQYRPSDKDLEWLAKRICAEFDPLKKRALKLIMDSEYYFPEQQRSTKLALEAAKERRRQELKEVHSILHFSYRFKKIISTQDCSDASYPNNIDPHQKCGEYYDCEELRIAVERGWIEPTLDKVESTYKNFEPKISRSSLRL